MNGNGELTNFCYPYCKEVGCDGILNIEINDDFSIDFQCDKNDLLS